MSKKTKEEKLALARKRRPPNPTHDLLCMQQAIIQEHVRPLPGKGGIATAQSHLHRVRGRVQPQLCEGRARTAQSTGWAQEDTAHVLGMRQVDAQR